MSVVDCQQTEQNLLGQTVRQTRSGANGSTLETSMVYDTYGRTSQVTATGQPVQSYAYDVTGEQAALTQSVGEVWRKQQSEAEYLLRDGNVWQKQVTVQSCSDADITPLTQQTLTRLSGFSPECSFESESVCQRGNITRTYGTDAERVTVYPSRTNPEIVCYAFGDLVEMVDSACVTNRFEVDALGRQVATVDGRGNRTVYAYDAKNNLVSATDAIGAVTAYGYDVMGQAVAVTNALGNVTVYEYDLRGNKTYEGGATYPVRYAYDVFGNKTAMTTYRNEASGVGDTTTWAYDEASGVLLSKTYADGKGLTYTYTDDGKLATRTNARGIVTTYTYDDWGQLLSIDYADTTPDIAYTYDALGRQTAATDAAGTTTFTYDVTGQLTSEQVNGLYSKTLTRHYDTFGRNVGYSVDGDRKQSITYDSATGRIAESDGFRWEYLAASNLKSQLTYPNDAVVTWTYEPHRDLLTAVTNATTSTYTYTYDLLGRRLSQNDLTVKYNHRDEIISIDNVFDIKYDDAGNRKVAGDVEYVTNNCNQYTRVEEFSPIYDADGNQTRIKTGTGIWDVQYDAENRPVKWTCEKKTILMIYDERGRRIKFHFMYDDSVEHQVEDLVYFFYDNYSCVECMNNNNHTLQSFTWEPSDNMSPSILKFYDHNNSRLFYYMHDAMRNVVVLMDPIGLATGNYKYSIFGDIISSKLSNKTSTYDITMQNRFCFSSEWFDVELGLIYYNYRNYHPNIGRWLSRDPLLNVMSILSIDDAFNYLFVKNNPFNFIDLLGLAGQSISIPHTRNTVRYNPPNPDAGVSVPHVDICGPGGNKIASLNFNPDGTLGSGREGSSINDITKGAKNFIEQTFGPKARKAFQGLKNYCPPCPANNSIPRVPQGPNGKNGNMPSPVTVRNSGGFPSGNGRGGIRGGGAGGGGAGCFKAGTLILTPNGLHTIDELNIGDVVLTYNFHKKEVQQNRIVDKVEILTEDIITIKTQTSCIIECSYKHLFYTTRGVKRAEQLMVGDLLLSKDSKGLLVPTRIVEIDDVSTTLQKVYNIGVEKNHNFFVGQDAILTHNQKPLALKSPMLFGI